MKRSEKQKIRGINLKLKYLGSAIQLRTDEELFLSLTSVSIFPYIKQNCNRTFQPFLQILLFQLCMTPFVSRSVIDIESSYDSDLKLSAGPDSVTAGPDGGAESDPGPSPGDGSWSEPRSRPSRVLRLRPAATGRSLDCGYCVSIVTRP